MIEAAILADDDDHVLDRRCGLAAAVCVVVVRRRNARGKNRQCHRTGLRRECLATPRSVESSHAATSDCRVKGAAMVTLDCDASVSLRWQSLQHRTQRLRT